MREHVSKTIKALQNHLKTGLVILLSGSLIALGIGAGPASATPFTMTVPGTNIQIPGNYPEAGGIVLVLQGVNGNFYFQISNPSAMMSGFQNQANGLLVAAADATNPQRFRGQPAWQLAPAYTVNCGVTPCAEYFGGGVQAGWVRFSADDGDTDRNGGPNNFDVDDITLLLADTPDGTAPNGPVNFAGAAVIGNWSDPATETTNVSGTIASASTTGFPDGAFNTGWFTIANQTVLNSFLTPNRIVRWGASDADPNDNRWNFRIGNDADTSVVPERVAPGIRLTKSALDASFQFIGEEVDYSYLVENVGTVFIDNIDVSDDQVAGVLCPRMRLDPNESMVCTATDIVTQADLDADGISNTATVTGTPQAATLSPRSDSAFVPAINQISSLAIVKGDPALTDADGSGTISLGDTLTYTVTVSNDGTVTQNAVRISDPLLTPNERVCASVSPGETCLLSGTLSVTQAHVDAGEVVNTASVTSVRITTPLQDSVTTAVPQTRQIGLNKRAQTASFAAVGETLSYIYDVTNLGNVTITGAISVSDDRIASVNCPALPAGGLAPNGAITCSGTDAVSQGDLDAGSVTNTAIASDGITTSPEDSVRVNAVQSAGLAMTKTAAPQTYAMVGEVIGYEYRVTNTGNVTVTSPISVSDDQVSVTCASLPAGGLAPGATLACMATDTISQADLDAGSLTNTASASDGTTVSAAVSETVTATQTRALAMTKTASPQTYSSVGDLISYAYAITNTGNVSVTDVLSVSDDRISTVSCPALPAGGLVPGASLTCSGQDSVTQGDLDAGEITNTASATDGGVSTAPVTETVTAAQSPALRVLKTADVTGVSSPARVGDEIVYTVKARNIGNVSLTGVGVSDPLLGGDVTGNCEFPATSGVLGVDDEAICVLTYSVAQSDIDTGAVRNTATAIGTPPVGGPVSDSNDNPVETLLAQAPAFQVAKTATEINFSVPGDEVRYDYVVTNTGNTTITAPVAVSDDRIASVACPALPAGGLGPSDALTCTATYIVTQADLDNGSVTNLATASDGTTTSPLASETIPANQNPGLQLTKTSADTSFDAIGDVLTYTFTLENTGNLTLTGDFTVTDDRIGSFVCFTGNLLAGTSQSCQRTDIVELIDLDAGQVTNQAFAVNGNLTTVPVSFTIMANQQPALTLDKRALSTTFDSVGDTLSYEYDLANTGNVTINGISLTDDRIADVSCPASMLGPNQSFVCTGSDTVTQADINAGSVTNTASATGTPRGGTLAPAGDSVTVSADQNPALSFQKSALATSFSEIGDVLDYQYRVENIGNISVSGLSVTDNRIASVTCPRVMLEPGQVTICSGSDTVSQADLDAGFVTNMATLNGTPAAGALAPQIAEATVNANQVTALSVLKDAAQANYAAVGDEIDYTYKVSNTGNTTITEPITVSDDRVIVSCPALPTGGLAPGAALTCAATDTVSQGDLDGGSVTNTASASTGATSSAPVSLTVPANQSPALGLAVTPLTAGFDSIQTFLDYNFEITNTGNVTLAGPVTVSDTVIATVNCPSPGAGGLAPGQSVICTGRYQTTQDDVDAGFVTNQASASANGTVSETISATVNGTQAPALSLTKTASPTVFSTAGEVINYTYIVQNSGNVTVTEAIAINDDRIATVSCPPVGDGLLPGESLTCLASYSVTQADLDAGSVTNLAIASSGAVSSAQVSETATANQERRMRTTKRAVAVAFTQPGDQVDYEYVIENTGNVTVTEPVTVSDNLIPSVPCPALAAGGLAPGDTLTCLASYTVTQEDLDRGSVTNIATSSDGVTSSAPASETIPANASPSLVATKRAVQTSYAMAGDQLTYEYTVRNNGNVTLTGQTSIVDDLIGTIDCFTGNIPPAEVVTCQASYSVSQQDVDDGAVTNVAFARNGNVSSPTVNVTVTADQQAGLALSNTPLTASYARPGDMLDYEFRVTNAGNTTITARISVTDSRVQGVNCPALAAGGLAPGQSIVCTGSITVTQSDIDAGFVTNTAIATDGSVSSEAQQATVSGDQARSLSLTKTPLSASFSAPGQELSYEYVLTNTGNTTLNGALGVTDDRIGDVACPAVPQGGLIPNGQLTCTGSETATQAMLDAGAVTNTARGRIGAVQSGAQSATVTAAQDPRLTVGLSANATNLSTPPRAGETITYTINVQNTGNVSLDTVSVESGLGAGDVTSQCVFPGANGELDVGQIATCVVSYNVTQDDVDAGGVSNSAIASAIGPNAATVRDVSDAGDNTVETPGLNGATDGDPTNDPTVTFFGAAPSLALTLEALAEDYNAPGETLVYRYTVTNTGNVTLTEAVDITDNRIANVTCDPLPVGGLAPGAQAVCTGDLVVEQGDLDAGFVETIATARSGAIASPEASERVNAAQAAAFNLTKTAGASELVGGPLYDITYTLLLENTGNVTLRDLALVDDLATAFAPAIVVGRPTLSQNGFGGSGGLNAAYDGQSDINLLTGNLSLGVGARATVTIQTRVDISTGLPETGNVAAGTSAEVSDPVLSDDASVTPDNPNDRNATRLDLVDTDGDGVPDGAESRTADRDGDGAPDAEDYDPTGYFYCEESGAILQGGRITVSGPSGANSAVGTANDITIIADGSEGFYQFFVSAPGRYTLTPTYPLTGEPSQARLPSEEAFDVSSALPSNPALLGSTEILSTGQLANASAQANSPFYLAFEIETGDPAIFANNIPLQSCGVPSVSLSKTVVEEPQRNADGRMDILFDLTAMNTGQTVLENVVIEDNLAEAFGTGAAQVVSVEITDAPEASSAEAASDFDGAVKTELLTDGTRLLPGQSMTARLRLSSNSNVAGEFTNVATVRADPPLADVEGLIGPNGGAPVLASAEASVTIAALADPSQLRVTKTARPSVVQIGDAIRYRVTVENQSTATMSNLRVVDRPPFGLAYVPGSSVLSTLDGARLQVEPDISRGQLAWTLNGARTPGFENLAAGETLTLDLSMVASPSASFGELTNTAFVQDVFSGATSDLATAVVEFIPEPTFDCTPVIGRVFEDANGNGYLDDGEVGIPGARLLTVNGDNITTDEHGRYHIPCAIVPDAERGSNYVLKVDGNSLPLGYVMTSENPRVVRATRGKFLKMNFGARAERIDRIEISGADFDAEGNLIAEQTGRDSESSLLITNQAGAGESAADARIRMNAARDGLSRNGRKVQTELSYSGVQPVQGVPSISTTVDALRVEKLLSLSTELVVDQTGKGVLYAHGFWNYGAWIKTGEVRLFASEDTVRGEPLAIVPLNAYGVAALPIELTNDIELATVLRVYDAKGRFDETRPRLVRPIREDSSEVATLDGDRAVEAFGADAIALSNIPVNGATVRVYGHNITGETAEVFGQVVRVDESGKFVAEAILPDGLQTVDVTAAGQRVIRDVDVKTRDFSGVGLLETTIGQRQSDEGVVSVEGRAAFYVRGRLSPRVRVTATADTGEAGLDDIFGQLDERDDRNLLRRLDPDRFYPVYGDDSTITEDAPTSGRFYLRVERDDDYVVWGNYQTGFNDTEYARIERTLYGAKLHWDENGNPTALGDARASVDAFLSDPGTRSARDELRGTGGSVYFLRNADLAIGSDIVRVETRDVISGIVSQSRILVYGEDYDIDYIQGRIILNQPLGSTSDDGRLFSDGGLSGDQVFVVAEYEFTGTLGEFDQLAFGGRGTRWFGDHLKVGGTYARDIQAGEETDIYGADVTLQATGETYLKAEFALTDGAGLSTFRSLDGGFTFEQKALPGATGTPLAVLVEGTASLADLGLGEGRVSAYYRNREAGFAGFGEQTTTDATQYGAALNAPLIERVELAAQLDVVNGGFSGGRSVGEVVLIGQVTNHVSLQTGLSYQDDNRIEGSLAVGARLQYGLDESNLAYLFGQAGVSGADNEALTDRVGVGAELSLNEKLTAGAEVSSGAAGLGSEVSLRYAKDEFSESYLNYDLPTRSDVGERAGGLSNADGGLTLGARRRLVDGLSVFGEERRRFGSTETGFGGLTRAFGVDYSPAEAWTFGLSTEFGQVGPFDREAVSVSGGYKNGPVSVGVNAEVRFDDNEDTGEELEAYLVRVTAQAQVSDGLRLQGKLNYADADGSANGGAISFQAAQFTEASLAAAYRPIAHDRLNVLAKLVFLEDLSPAGQRLNGDILDFRQRSAIASIDANYQVTQRCAVGGKYGYRRGEVTEGRASTDFFSSSAWLGVGRLDCHIVGQWDGLIEARYLDIGDGVTQQWGSLTGLYRNLGDHLKIGGGVTWGGVNEDFLALNAQRDIGWYMNLIGAF